jgi:hypothetical protein
VTAPWQVVLTITEPGRESAASTAARLRAEYLPDPHVTVRTYGGRARPERGAEGELARELARFVLAFADLGQMPDSFWKTDRRVALARLTLGVPDDGRYTHARLWEEP